MHVSVLLSRPECRRQLCCILHSHAQPRHPDQQHFRYSHQNCGLSSRRAASPRPTSRRPSATPAPTTLAPPGSAAPAHSRSVPTCPRQPSVPPCQRGVSRSAFAQHCQGRRQALTASAIGSAAGMPVSGSTLTLAGSDGSTLSTRNSFLSRSAISSSSQYAYCKAPARVSCRDSCFGR